MLSDRLSQIVRSLLALVERSPYQLVLGLSMSRIVSSHLPSSTLGILEWTILAATRLSGTNALRSILPHAFVEAD
jgi:hypothetical protein